MVTLLPWVVSAFLAIGQPHADVGHICMSNRDFNAQAAVWFDNPENIVAMANTDAIWFRKQHCKVLNRMVMGAYVRPERASFVLLVAAHEVAHTMGIDDEAEATCYGLLNVKRLAKQLGHPRPFKLARKAQQWKKLLPREYRKRCK